MSTRATLTLDRLKIAYTLHSYDEIEKTAHEVARKLDLEPRQVFKTLLTTAGGQYLLALIPADRELSEKRLARAVRAATAQMADPRDIERITGYVRGSISPLATRRPLTVVIDASAETLETMAVSAGARGQELLMRPSDLARATGAMFAEICSG